MRETLVTYTGAPPLTLQETGTGDPLLARSQREAPGPQCWCEAVSETIIELNAQNAADGRCERTPNV